MSLFKITVTTVYEKDTISVARPTALGNPFVMKTEADRNEVCDKYQKWFDNKIAEKDPNVLYQLRDLWTIGKKQGYLKLGCHCAPKRCHADTIAEFLKKYI